MFKQYKLLASLLAVIVVLTTLAASFYYQDQSVLSPPVESAEPHGPSHKLLVIAPHCDDEVLAAGGIIQQALRGGSQVKVVIMTNGDGFTKAADVSFPNLDSRTQRYLQLAQTRQKESIAALRLLGLSEKEIIFLGYPDKGLSSLWSKNWDWDKPYFNNNTQTNYSPYLNDYSPQAPYTGWNVVRDLTKIIQEYQPTEIYYPHPNDVHPDHWATNSFVKYVLSQNGFNSLREHLYLVHRGMWPTTWVVPSDQGLRPPDSLVNIGTQWMEIPLTSSEVQKKKEAILAHATQIRVMKHYLLSFARTNELFGYYPDLLLAEGKKELLIQDPKADLWKSKVNGDGDVIRIYGNLSKQKLSLEIMTRSAISKKVSYHVHLRFLRKEASTQLADLVIKDQQVVFSHPSRDSLKKIAGLKVKKQKNRIILEIPLTSLPAFHSLYLNVESKKGTSLVDKTAWRLLTTE